MSTFCQMFGTGVKWMLKGKHQPLHANQLPSVLCAPVNSRKISISVVCRSNMSSQPHVSLKNVSSVETDTRRIFKKNLVSLRQVNSSSSKMNFPTPLDSNPQLTGEVTLQTQGELISDDDDDPKYMLRSRKALDPVSVENSSELSSFIDGIAPTPPLSLSLAAYVNTSQSLQELVKLGVDLSVIEEKSQFKFIKLLKFERDMKNHIHFLHDIGVPADKLGKFLTKNPLIFQEDLDNLRVRINYLEVKKFSPEGIARIVTACPLYLSLDVKTVDRRLGFLQKTFKLMGDEIRLVVTKCPYLIPYKYERLLEIIFTIKETMGFSKTEMKQLLVAKPKIYTLGKISLMKRFNVLHSLMGLSHERILHFPAIFLTRDFIIEQRHRYLVKCSRAQYDPMEPNYVSLEDIATLHDGEFCRKCAGTSLLDFDEFLKTL